MVSCLTLPPSSSIETGGRPKLRFFSGNILLQIFLGLAFVILILVIPVWIKRKNPWGWYDKMSGRG